MVWCDDDDDDDDDVVVVVVVAVVVVDVCLRESIVILGLRVDSNRIPDYSERTRATKPRPTSATAKAAAQQLGRN
jgi:hypothetical protein